MIDENIDVLALQETNWAGENFADISREYTWFGSRVKRISDGQSTHVDDLSAQHLCRPGSSQYEDPVT